MPVYETSTSHFIKIDWAITDHLFPYLSMYASLTLKLGSG